MFTKGFGKYACENDTIKCHVDGFDCVATIHRDDCNDTPDERDEGFWPSQDPKAAGYVLPENFKAEQAKADKVMRTWKNDEWFYCGVAVTVFRADVQLTSEYGHALWGVECNYPDSDNGYLMDVANELLPDALESAKAKIKELSK